jgi:response regulator of citrate/malate metabolism
VIRVLVVEDDPVLADAHRAFTERVPGFQVVGVAHDGRTALATAARAGVDLLLLDFGLPDMTGLDVCRALRAAGAPVDVIAVTSMRDLEVVRAAVSSGVVQYLLKPFTFAAFRDRLERYADYRRQMQTAAPAAQHDVDRALATLRGTATAATLPKGLTEDTLATVVDTLRGAEALSAAEVAAAVGVSRVTARRYLEHLADSGSAARSPRYGSTGRPEHVYRWVHR